ncbi:MAG: hypothetical protein J6R41_01125 [Paludibacteraceae bacterium]|nr:hypothetical protein [Paludibacteraceae bacterium]
MKKIKHAITLFFESLLCLLETIVYLPAYLIWVAVSYRRMHKRCKINRKKYEEEENED